MKFAHDVHAETNAAYCATVLAQFCKAYERKQGHGSPIVAAYLALPIVLSEDLADTFDHAISTTGLLLWIDRHPRIRRNLASRVNATLQITTDAIRFGCFAGLLRLEGLGHISAKSMKLPKAVSSGVAEAALKRAKMLGTWCADAGSTRAVVEALGVSV